MLRFKCVAIQGFRSFRSMQVLEFRGQGFHHLGGENRADPEMGANGSGKSSILEAVVWCLYGKTSRGVRGKNVANWLREDPTSVAVEFVKDGLLYQVLRTWDDQGPNALTIRRGTEEPRPVEQADVETLVGADYTTFLHTVMMSQFGSYFFDLAPTQQLSVFSDLLDLGRWEDASKDAKCVADGHREAATHLAGRVEKASGTIEALEAEAKRLEKASAAFADENAAKLNDLERQSDDAFAVAAEAREALRVAKADHAEAQDAFDTAKRRLVEVDDSLRDRYQPRARDRLRDLKDAKAEVVAIRKKRKDAKSMRGRDCPICTRPMRDLDVGRLLTTLDAQLSAAKKTRRKAARRHDEADARLEKALRRRRKIDEAFTEAESDLERARRALGSARSASARADEKASAVREKLEAGRDLGNPYAASLEGVLKRLRGAKRQAGRAELELGEVKTLEDRHRFWVHGFKQLRLWVVKRALLEFEVATNNALGELGLDGWSVRYDVEKETGRGTVRRGFAIFIRSPGVEAEVPWEVWCGGETQRLRIAGAIGLSTVATRYRGFHAGLEMWDEPTAHLDADGVQDLLVYFKERSRSCGLELWLVDHRSLDAGEFDGTAWVIKEPDAGSVVAPQPPGGTR